MPSDLTTVADPLIILLAWASGLALVGGFVSLTKVVGIGFTWLAAGTTILVGVSGAFGEGAVGVRAGLIAVALGALVARRRVWAGGALIVGGAALITEAASIAGWLPALSASLALGGVTGEMLLGHWYLVDPRLPRWTLRNLAALGVLGLAFDAVVLVSTGELAGSGQAVAFWLLLATSIGLMAAVLAALRYPAYSGVMAATGLSYLAVLTTLGAVFLGRSLVAGLGPFPN